MIIANSKWAMAKIFTLDVFDTSTNECYTILDDLKSCTIDNTGGTQYAQGGDGNIKIVGFDSNKACMLNCQSATFSGGSIGLSTGVSPVIAANTNYVYTDIFVASSATAATLTKTPVGTAGSEVLYIYKLNSDGTLGAKFTQVGATPGATTFTVSTKTVTFGSGSGLSANDALVAFYNITTASTTVTLTNKTNVFSKTCKVVANGLARDIYTSVDYAAQFILWRVKFDNSFKLDISAESTPAVRDLAGETLLYTSGGVKKFWDLIITDESAAS